MPTSPGVLTEALTRVWAQLQHDHPVLPAALITVSAAPPTSDHGPERWRRDGEQPLTGIVVDVETLNAGPEEVLTLVLHDAAHVLNWLRGVKDTTMRGVYHNQKYLTAAEDVGLAWPEDAERTSKGYADPVLTAATRKRFAEDLMALEAAVAQTLPYVTLPTPTGRAARPDRLMVQCGCNPPRKLRISQTVLAQGPVTCGVCGVNFAVR